MKYLNLTEGFNPFNSSLENTLKYDYFVFPGGEPHIKIEDNYSQGSSIETMVTIRIKSFEDVGKLMVAIGALYQIGWSGATRLFVPYMPGARQDRKAVNGEVITAKLYAEIFNDMKFAEVELFDPHSDVCVALLDNPNPINNHKFVQRCLQHIYPQIGSESPYLISPDAGANKKIKDLSVYLNKINHIEVVKCDKSRDTVTGALSGFEVYKDDLNGKDCIIVDDVCDGGGTFVGLAEELKLKGAGDLYLIVSHGIFSKGFKELRKHFKAIYTTDSWRSNISMETPEIEKGSEIVTIIPFKDLL